MEHLIEEVYQLVFFSSEPELLQPYLQKLHQTIPSPAVGEWQFQEGENITSFEINGFPKDRVQYKIIGLENSPEEVLEEFLPQTSGFALVMPLEKAEPDYWSSFFDLAERILNKYQMERRDITWFLLLLGNTSAASKEEESFSLKKEWEDSLGDD
ncbi:MAG: hypothetical protein D6785_07990, partial [Planctomycetota bacterium]